MDRNNIISTLDLPPLPRRSLSLLTWSNQRTHGRVNSSPIYKTSPLAHPKSSRPLFQHTPYPLAHPNRWIVSHRVLILHQHLKIAKLRAGPHQTYCHHYNILRYLKIQSSV